MIIVVNFLNAGVPATGLTPEITVYNLITDAKVIDAASMAEVADGFYKYDFTDYDATVPYAFKADGGITLDASDRYRLGSNQSDQTQYATSSGSLGEAMMAFATGKYHFDKRTKKETLYRPDGTTVVAQRTVTDNPNEVSKS